MNRKIGYSLFLLVIVPFIAYRLYVSPTINYEEDKVRLNKGVVAVDKTSINSSIVPVSKNNKAIYIDGFALNDKGHLLLENEIGRIILWLDNPDNLDLEMIMDISSNNEFEDIDVVVNGRNIYKIKNNSVMQHRLVVPKSLIGDNILEIKFIHNNTFQNILHLTSLEIMIKQ